MSADEHRHWIYGHHAVQSALARGDLKVDELLISKALPKAQTAEIEAMARQKKIAVLHVPMSKLDHLFQNLTHQGIAIRLRQVRSEAGPDLEDIINTHRQDCLLLILDGIQDPHNLGACLRTAAAAGVHAVIIPKNRAVTVNATVRKVASGGADVVPVFSVTNLAQTMQMLQKAGIWIHGTDERATDSLYQINLKGPIAWVMGSEGNGMRSLTRKHCDILCSIPTDADQACLNVSVATGVCLFETVRQRSGP